MTRSPGPAPPVLDVLDVEQAVGRLARVVLHASALADRMLALPDPGTGAAGDRAARLERLRDTAARGQVALLRLVGEDGRPAARET